MCAVVVVVFFDETSALQRTLGYVGKSKPDKETSHIWFSFISVLSSPVRRLLVYMSFSPTSSSLALLLTCAVSLVLFLSPSVIYWQWIRDEGVCRRRDGNIQGNGCFRPDFITSGWEMVGRNVCVHVCFIVCVCVSLLSDQLGISWESTTESHNPLIAFKWE